MTLTHVIYDLRFRIDLANINICLLMIMHPVYNSVYGFQAAVATIICLQILMYFVYFI